MSLPDPDAHIKVCSIDTAEMLFSETDGAQIKVDVVDIVWCLGSSRVMYVAYIWLKFQSYHAITLEVFPGCYTATLHLIPLFLAVLCAFVIWLSLVALLQRGQHLTIGFAGMANRDEPN